MRVQIHQLQIQIYEVKFTSNELNFTSYEFKSTSCKSKSTSREFKSTGSFPKIISLKSVGNSWGILCVQFLVIISCFTFPLIHGNVRFHQETKWLNIYLKEET